MNGIVDMDNVEQLDAVVVMNDEFEQLHAKRSTSDSNILESSIYSELQFPPSIGSISIGGGSSSNGAGVVVTTTAKCQLSTARAQLQMPPPQTFTYAQVAQVYGQQRSGGGGGGAINNKAKWSANVAANVGAQGAATAAATAYPPQYTAIFLDNGNAAANAMGQIANAAAAGSPYLNAPIVERQRQRRICNNSHIS
ncbi:unnamed protein product [Ceratitis capitata]|uniref:(Mediterranean fruit fly) hypothetical protein n=1 Tax=Ceratitis capitata TaxID=7213 RepID=A0A811VM98_CERCA|nr:unnamed protein product [Ceratitis capitata]